MQLAKHTAIKVTGADRVECPTTEDFHLFTTRADKVRIIRYCQRLPNHCPMAEHISQSACYEQLAILYNDPELCSLSEKPADNNHAMSCRRAVEIAHKKAKKPPVTTRPR